MKGEVKLNTWDRKRRDPLHEDHLKVVSGRVLIYSKSYSRVLSAGEGLRIAWPYTIVAYEPSVVNYL